MAIEGELVVRVETVSGKVTRARARSERPRVAGALFPGRPARQAGALAGALFAICGRAQSVAADSAVAAARGETPEADVRAARDARVGAETLHEHAWRLLVDWPRLAGLPPAIEALARARKALAPILEAPEGAPVPQERSEVVAWATRSVFGVPPQAFLACSTTDDLEGWMARAPAPVSSLAARLIPAYAPLGASGVDFLPHGADGWVAHALADAIAGEPGFDEAPHWNGEARETGPLARTAGHPLVAAAIARWGRGVGARFVARLVEMAAVLDHFGSRHGAVPLGGHAAIAWVETARGLLVHRAELDGERLAGYRIVAPTEWNFHPDGAFTRGAMALAADDGAKLERELRWLVASLDPCVSVRFEAGHA
jgi:hypothetical protein